VGQESLLGGIEAAGSAMMEQLPYERLTVAVSAVATAERAVAITRSMRTTLCLRKPLMTFRTRGQARRMQDPAQSAGLSRHCIERFVAGDSRRHTTNASTG